MAWMTKLKAMKDCKEQYEQIKETIGLTKENTHYSALLHDEINKKIKLKVVNFSIFDEPEDEAD